MPTLTPAARVAFAVGAEEARSLRAPAIDLEHVFIGLCKGRLLADPGGGVLLARRVEGIRVALNVMLARVAVDETARIPTPGRREPRRLRLRPKRHGMAT